MMNFQFAGYFKINKVTHLEDDTYNHEYPEADIIPNAKNRWAMKFGTHASHMKMQQHMKSVVPTWEMI
jgi:hypothetical protein